MRLRSWVFPLVAILVWASPARAASLVVVGGILTGAEDVDVAGTLYDVEFVDASGVNLFPNWFSGDFDFITAAGASFASQALLSQVFLDTAQGNFDSSPNLTAGCSVDFCSALTPYGTVFDNESGLFLIQYFYAQNRVVNGDDIVAGFNGGLLSTQFLPEAVYARWVPSSTNPGVPEPATVALLGIGLVSIGARRWHRRKTS